MQTADREHWGHTAALARQSIQAAQCGCGHARHRGVPRGRISPSPACYAGGAAAGARPARRRSGIANRGSSQEIQDSRLAPASRSCMRVARRLGADLMQLMV